LEKAMMAKVKEGNFAMVPDMHGLVSGLKSLFTSMTNDGLEEARWSCGGAGFSMHSGIAHKTSVYKPYVTFEGDNILLNQQAAKTILKTVQGIMSGKPAKGFNEYLNNFDLQSSICKATSLEEFNSIKLLEEMIQVRSIVEISRVA
jgi:hypothetical protein